VELVDAETGGLRTVLARALVNAGGPWVEEIIKDRVHGDTPDKIRLVRGSHIVTRKLFDHNQPYIFQQSDGRIIFAIPYETDFTLIGTTDCDHEGDPGEASCTPDEAAYLRAAASEYFRKPVTAEDVVWSFSGVRPLYDDGATSATQATRDYVLNVVDRDGAAPLLNVFGGKITTYRRLAEGALAKLERYFPDMGGDWTAGAALPGGDFPVFGVEPLIAGLREKFPFVDDRFARRLVRAYGTEAAEGLGDASEMEDLGHCFGWNLTERELTWLMTREWARCAADVLWRRSKLGLRLSADDGVALDRWMHERLVNAGTRSMQ
jgi:glycerol-3-phosphate dehydrogenase